MSRIFIKKEKQSMKRKINLNEDYLDELIRTTVNESLSSWVNSNDVSYNEAIDILANEALNKIVDIDVFKNAVDIAECDPYDIQTFYSIVNEDVRLYNTLNNKSYSIKDFLKKNGKRYSVSDIFEDFVKDNWEDILDDNLVQAIYDRYDVSSVTNKNYYGGGGFETMRELEIDVRDKICELIKQQTLELKVHESVRKPIESMVDEDIDIKPENKGKFTKTENETGKTASQLVHSKNPTTRKRANFARMARRHWKPLKESSYDRIIKDSIRKVIRESVNEFTYSDSEDLGKGRHRQTITYNGKEIGYLLSIEKNILSPIEEIYIIPDVDYGLQGEGSPSLLQGKKGWIDFKRFTDYNEALNYAARNFEQIAYLFEYGDYD